MKNFKGYCRYVRTENNKVEIIYYFQDMSFREFELIQYLIDNFDVDLNQACLIKRSFEHK